MEPKGGLRRGDIPMVVPRVPLTGGEISQRGLQAAWLNGICAYGVEQRRGWRGSMRGGGVDCKRSVVCVRLHN
jgi:hypothetical protein